MGERAPRTDASSLHSVLKDSRHPAELERAERVLRGSALGKSQPLWNALMEAHGRVGQTAIAEDIFRECKSKLGTVDSAACKVMIHAWGRVQRPAKAAEYLRELEHAQGAPDVVAWAMAIDAFARTAPQEAERLLDEMGSVSPNEVCFNAIIAGYAARGQALDAERLVERMSKQGVRPDAYTYTALLQGHARARNGEQVESTWRHMMQAGVRPTPVSYHTLASARAALHGAAEAEAVLREAESAGMITAELYNVVLHAWAGERRPDRVEAQLRAMLASGVRPTPFTVSAVLGLWERLGQPSKAEAFVHWMAEAGAEPDAPCYNQVIRAYCNAGQLTEAERVLDAMKQRGVKPTSASYVALYTATRSNPAFRARAPHYRALLKQARRTAPKEPREKLKNHSGSSNTVK